MIENMSDISGSTETNAVNLYENDMADEFPVLKAFQQYIDSEQAKARKRMMLLCVFFSFILTIVIIVFVSLLVGADSRNQKLNDRLVEYAMRDRDSSKPSVVQQPAQDGSSFLLALSNKLNDIQATMAEDRKRAEKAAEESAKLAVTKKGPTTEALEIERLKALLAAEKEKSATEREKLRQAELEVYRRKHYPELYEKKPTAAPSSYRRTSDRQRESEEADKEIESILKDIKTIDYFDDEEDPDETRAPKKNSSVKRRAANASDRKEKDVAPLEDDVVEDTHAPSVKDSAGNDWKIPLE